jgi:nitric oxide reductase activation protein
MVYGHSTGYSSGDGSTVELYSYAEFESFDNDDRYRLMDISARSSNRDGAALRYVAERLSRRPEPVKLLILVSDGQPADTGYYGTAAEEDLRGIKHEYQRKGILFVAAAIGDDKENIERIYGDSFLDITDLNLLPSKLTAVVKKHLRF